MSDVQEVFEWLEKIPQHVRDNFPMGVSEEYFDTEAEMSAFLGGLLYADDVDVYHGPLFWRDGKIVVRIQVGDWKSED